MKDLVYVVLSEEEAKFASRIRRISVIYSEIANAKRINQVRNDSGEDLDEIDFARGAWIAGYEEEPAYVESIDLSEYSEDENIEFEDGSEIDYCDIIDLLEESKNIYTLEQLRDFMDDGDSDDEGTDYDD